MGDDEGFQTSLGGPVRLETDAGPVRPGEELAWTSLERYLRAAVPGLHASMRAEQFPDGSANLTYLVSFGDRKLVVRRPPFGTLAPGSHDMRREYRALSRLAAHFAPAPSAYAFCEDHSVIGADFLVLEYRHGVVVRQDIPPALSEHPRAAQRIGDAVVDTLAELHRLAPGEIGLGDLGRPDGFVERQVRGWMRRWDLVALENSDPGVAPLGQRLLDALPESDRVSVLHNDYKIDNCQFDPADPDRVKSVFDWDMATVGDPLVDLGTLLNYWPDRSDVDGLRPVTSPHLAALGLPARREVVERYALRTGFDVERIAWYQAFAAWKTAVVLQQLHARWVRGESADGRMAERGARVAEQARRAEAFAAEAGV